MIHTNRRRIRVCVLCLLLLMARPIKKARGERIKVMTFNVENLFDTMHDEGKNDYEYLPEGANEWTRERYLRKLRNVGEVISDVGGVGWPLLVGLVEVENEVVMDDLLHSTPLGARGYEYAITHSPDERGIDVALLYIKDLFCPDKIEEFQVKFPHSPHTLSRNILHVHGHLFNGVPLHVMVVHLPSRREGKRASDRKRKDVVSLLQAKCDSILNREPGASILVMGDFNTTPRDPITHVWAHPLASRRTAYRADLMYDLTSLVPSGVIPGSYRYRGVWQQIDRIVVSGSMLLADNPITYLWESARSVMMRRWMQQDADGELSPKRTYGGHFYMGGVSDHLPVVAQFVLARKEES